MIFIWSRRQEVYEEAAKLGLAISYSLRQYEKDRRQHLFDGKQATANILNGIMQADIAFLDASDYPSVHGAAVGQLKNKKGYRVLSQRGCLMMMEYSVLDPTLKNLRKVVSAK